MFTIEWWLWKCSALLKNLIPAISGPWCRKTHECANYWLIVTSFLENFGFNFGVGLWMLSHKKKQMMFHAHCPGMEIVDLLESLDLHNTTFAGLQQKPGPHSHHPAALFSGAASHYPHPHFHPHLHPHPVCQCNFITIDSSLSAPLLQVDSFNLHHLQFHGRCWWSATFPGVERSVYYSAHARDRVASLIQSSQEFAFVTSIR